MTLIEQAATNCFAELLKDNGLTANDPRFLTIITRHLTTLTKPLEEENKRLREALKNVLDGRSISNAIDARNLLKALTKPTWPH